MTSMSSQLESLAFIGEGSTKRKEILAKFLDLEFFEQKYKLCKEGASDMKGAIKRLEEVNFEEEISTISEGLKENIKETTVQQSECDTLQRDVEGLSEDQQQLSAAIDAIPAKVINVDEVQKNIAIVDKQIKEKIDRNYTLGRNLKENLSTLTKIAAFEKQFDVETYEQKLQQISERRAELDELDRMITRAETKKKVEQNKVDLLSQVPCGQEFSHCKFIRDAYAALESLGITKAEIENLSGKRVDAENGLNVLEPETVETHLEKYHRVMERRSGLISENAKIEVENAQNKTKIVKLKSDLVSLKDELAVYEENREAIENLGELISQKDLLGNKIVEKREKIEVCQEKVHELYRSHGFLEQKLENLRAQEQELADLREEYSANDLFMSCMHSNGISLDVIKRELPRINEEIAKVLANVVDFEVFMENDEKRLDIMIKHPRFDPRPLEMGSGAEKAIASMAIRIALLNVSSMPKGDVFILDEPGTALDEENMEGFVRILDVVKAHYKSVLLVSHLDSLKDCVDTQISIDKKSKMAYVNQ